MKLTIIGPNLPGADSGTFHVHAAGCADLKRKAIYRGMRYETNHEEHDTLESLVDSYYCDMMNENEEGSPWATWEAYQDEFRIFPCCNAILAPAHSEHS